MTLLNLFSLHHALTSSLYEVRDTFASYGLSQQMTMGGRLNRVGPNGIAYYGQYGSTAKKQRTDSGPSTGTGPGANEPRSELRPSKRPLRLPSGQKQSHEREEQDVELRGNEDGRNITKDTETRDEIEGRRNDGREKSPQLVGRITVEDRQRWGKEIAQFIRSDADAEPEPGAEWVGKRPLGQGSFGIAGLWELRDGDGNVTQVQSTSTIWI